MSNSASNILNIVFEDEYLFVVDKPSGVLSQPGKTLDGSIATLAKQCFPNATGPMLVHRLDMDTSGLMVLAKNRTVHRDLQQQFEKRTIGKQYVALLDGLLVAQGGRIRLPVRVDIDHRPVQIVCFEHGKSADTLWHKSATNQPGSGHVTRVVFTPITGRTHQLRVHAAHALGLNAPIVGDRLYGNEQGRLMLHAKQLSFTHPVSGLRIKCASATPF